MTALLEPLLEAIERAGHHLTATDPEVVVLGFGSELDHAKLRTAIRAALAGATIITTNPDVLTPVHDGDDPCVGVLTAAVAAAAPSATPIVVGKHLLLIEPALGHLGTAKHETIMVGDQVVTDIAAGKAAGLRLILRASSRATAALPLWGFLRSRRSLSSATPRTRRFSRLQFHFLVILYPIDWIN